MYSTKQHAFEGKILMLDEPVNAPLSVYYKVLFFHIILIDGFDYQPHRLLHAVPRLQFTTPWIASGTEISPLMQWQSSWALLLHILVRARGPGGRGVGWGCVGGRVLPIKFLSNWFFKPYYCSYLSTAYVWCYQIQSYAIMPCMTQGCRPCGLIFLG